VPIITSLSRTAFMVDDELIDTVVMTYEARNCGGARIHAVSNNIMTLTAIADELHRGLPVDLNVLKHFTKS